MSRLCGQYLHSLGIPEPLHSLRHYFGSSLYAARQDLRLNWGASTSWGRSKGCGAAVLVVCSPADGTAMLCHVGLAAYAAVRWSRGASASADDQALP